MKNSELKNFEAAIEFCLKKFHIKNKPKITVEKCLTRSLGYYDHLSNEIVIKPVDDLRKEIKNLFHEFVHCHQYNCGKLKTIKTKNFWKNKECVIKDYWSLPWEINARNVSEKMYKKYFNHGKRA